VCRCYLFDEQAPLEIPSLTLKRATAITVKNAYFHNYDEGHLGSKDMPELHIMSIFILMIRRVPIISVPEKWKSMQKINYSFNSHYFS
jgi:hypothetical protein